MSATQKPCRECSGQYEPKPWEVRANDFLCVPCRRASLSAYRARRKAEGRPVVPGRVKDEYARRKAAGYYEKPEVRARKAEQMRSYRLHHATAHHHKARELVAKAVARGDLVRQPCEVCGAHKVHAHHDDYSRPLDIRWLCPPHHREHHAKARATGSPS